LKDFQIRELLRKTELSQYINDNDSKVVEEMKIPIANARIDMAVINGSFHGYEIKGSSDTLQRLPNQLVAYSYVFDYLVIITEEKYIDKIISMVPDWVAVAVCSNKESEIIYNVKKEGHRNVNKNGFYLAKLLWKEELLDVLKENNFKNVYGAVMNGANLYQENLGPGLLVIGNESTGISSENLKLLTRSITIPSHSSNGTESLNAAMAGAIILSEFFRKIKI